jgi:hypothetical protein
VRNADSIPGHARDLISRGGTVLDHIVVDDHEARALVRVSPEAVPVEFVIDLQGLERFIEAARDSAPDVFPDVDGTEGALRLVSEHLWAEVGSAEGRVHAVGVDRRGQTWRRAEPARQRSALPLGDYRWSAERE